MRILKWFKKKEPKYDLKKDGDIAFYINSTLYAVNLGLRGIVDKNSKQLNSDHIRGYLEMVFRDGFDTGYQQGQQDAISKTIENKLSKN